MSRFSISLLVEHTINDAIDAIAQLRIDIFKEYPYLYDGDLESEAKYLKKFTHAKDAITVVLKDDERVVGAITGLPLQYEEEAMLKPWREGEIAITKIYYFSEILLYEAYRGQGLGQELFDTAQEWVQNYHRYDYFTLATVDREIDLAPQSYHPTDSFWLRNGYVKQSDKIAYLTWRDLDKAQEDAKPMHFWTKKLD